MASDVRSFYKDQNVLLTGGIGFMGKIIVEKLLRTCDVGGIYLIVRPKKGLSPEQRLRSFVEEPVFERLREMNTNFIDKIYIIEGDLSKKKLGLTAENIELIRNTVNVVFHCGASLTMDYKLGDSVMTNVRGTSELLDIVGEAKKLRAFVLVSTAYSNSCQKVIEEAFYKPPISPDLLIAMIEELKPDILDNISPGLIGERPNSYAYSKAVGENLLLTKGKNLPVGLFRPAIVTSAVSEPLPGWSDNLYGALGVVASIHCGILRVARAFKDNKTHTVPVDMSVNSLLCLAWDIDERWRNSSANYDPPVLNFSGKNTKLLMTFKQYTDCSKLDYIPFQNAYWYQMFFMINSEYNYLILKFLLHTVPAYIMDFFLILLNRKPKIRRLYTKIDKFTDALTYFAINEWDIDNGNVFKLWDKLGESDRKVFNFDINKIDIEDYITNQINGLKKYVLKEDMTESKSHRQRYKRLMVLHYTLKYLLIGLVTYLIYKGLCKLLNQNDW